MQDSFENALDRVITRAAESRSSLSQGLPHWADTSDGVWTTTPDGDWTGGAYIGELWLSYYLKPHLVSREDAVTGVSLMLPKLDTQSAFKGFGFYLATGLPSLLFDDQEMRKVGLRAARSLCDMYDDALGLIPLGSQAEEAASVGAAECSIDSLLATPLLLWAADETGESRFDEVAENHLRRVLDIHVRPNGSVIQSSTLDPQTGKVTRTHTHKGFNDESTWGRAQGWAMLYSAHAAVKRPDNPLWQDYAIRTLDWWMEHVPSDLVSFWDFDDPAIPDTSRDTAATAIAVAAALKLSTSLGDEGGKYRDFGRRTAGELASRYLTPVSSEDERPVGILTGGCFTRRSTVRSQDAASDVELIFGSYFFFESLAVLTGRLPAGLV